MEALKGRLFDLIAPARLTAVVDIGANPLDGDPPYKPMLTERVCTVVGFEPQPDALARLHAKRGDLETYLPYAIGDGQPGRLNICAGSGMTSLLTPDPNAIHHFPVFQRVATVVSQTDIETRRLDDVTEITALDLLKIDVQGSELAVFKGGREKLKSAIAVHTEMSFIPLYKDQPTFGDIDRELRMLGFVPHALASTRRQMIAPLKHETNPAAAMNQILEADIVYVRDFMQPNEMSSEQLKHLAMTAHYCYRSFDLAANCLFHLTQRKEIAPNALAVYAAQFWARN